MQMHPHGAWLRAFGTRAAAAWLTAVLVVLLGTVPALADVTGLVRGTVTVDGSPRAGLTVALRGGQTTRTTRTAADGRFVFARVPFGAYTITAHLDGHPDATALLEVVADSVNTLALAIGAPAQIGHTSSTTAGVGGLPVSVTTIDRQAIEALPQSGSLDRLIETVPGIVQFSYDEPVAHGFHGVSYEIDGAPLPQTTSSDFAEILDPRNIDSLEVFTGAFPAEFGGQRQGAVVNIVTKRDVDIPHGSLTEIGLGGGTYGTAQANLSESLRAGTTDVFFNANLQRTNRGLDAPTENAIHDDANLSDLFLRTITNLGPRDQLSFDYSNQYNGYQIPTNTSLGAYDQTVNVPGQDDVEREYSRFWNLNYTHTSKDGNGYVQFIPWMRSSRVVYAGDLANDVLGLDYSSTDCNSLTDAAGNPVPAPCSLAGLSQDRAATVFGARAAYFRTFGAHAVKIGADASVENFVSDETIAQSPASPFFTGAPFGDDVAQRGLAYDAYVEDTWTPLAVLSVQAGLRYDFSDGFVQGNQLEPRIGVNLRVARHTIAHAYYGRLYAAPALEDTRRDAVVFMPASSLPVYDLKPETDSYYEIGLAQTFAPGFTGTVNVWQRNVWNVLDTTQIFPTPIFATYNSALGLAHGFELRLDRQRRDDSWYLSGTFSQSVAGGISGGTFLFPPTSDSLQPEDHDQAVTITDGYTRRLSHDGRSYATLGSDYGTGFPVCFADGSCGRLTPHLTFDASVGRRPQRGSLGFSLNALNVTNYRYLIKVDNGFNTTQWAPGAQVTLEVLAAF